MIRHPRDRHPWNRAMSRREMIRLSGGVALSAAVLAACGGDEGGGSGTGIRIASPSDPATLPIPDDNAPIESGLEPEAGPLKIYNWDEYIWPKVVKEFAAQYGVDFEISTFYNMNEAVAKIKTGQVDFDVFFPTIDVVPKLAAAKLIQPLNHSYIPNLNKNVWPELADPWYDKGSRYTVPYTVYTTGIAWRTDMVDDDIAALDNPYDIFWDPRYRGKVGIYDSYRDAMNMVLLRNGITDINTDDPKDIELVKRDLVDMADKTSVRTTINGAYAKLPEGDFAIHQSWSGDIVAAPYYFPESNYGDPKGLLRFWWPENGKGEIGNDTIAIPKAAKNPVLAHLFLDFMLQNQEAIDNFSWVGYQPPIKAIDPDKLVKQQYVVPNLKEAIVRKEYFDSGYKALTLPPDVDGMWQDAWSDFKSGA
jgi:spermidine/putrescine transport system substrate-binding protein